jgi:hypothetical protein
MTAHLTRCFIKGAIVGSIGLAAGWLVGNIALGYIVANLYIGYRLAKGDL